MSDVTVRIEIDEEAMKEDELERLVVKASSPNLATLFKRGKDAGLLAGGTNWSGSE